MSILSRLFGGGGGGGSSRKAQPETHKGFAIYPEPIAEKGGYRIAARIEMVVDGETMVHRMIRADVCSSAEAARDTTLLKAKSLIDQQGRAIFD